MPQAAETPVGFHAGMTFDHTPNKRLVTLTPRQVRACTPSQGPTLDPKASAQWPSRLIAWPRPSSKSVIQLASPPSSHLLVALGWAASPPALQSDRLVENPTRSCNCGA